MIEPLIKVSPGILSEGSTKNPKERVLFQLRTSYEWFYREPFDGLVFPPRALSGGSNLLSFKSV